MNRYVIIFLILFSFSFLIYSVYLVNTKKKLSFKGVLICILASALFMTYAILKPKPTASDLREELDNYPKSVIAEYLREYCDFSEIVDMYGDDYLRDYIWFRYNITLP